MNRRIGVPLFVIVLSAITGGCAKDEGPLFIPTPQPPGEPIDTAYFSLEVVPIFIEHCWVCHPDMGGLDLSPTAAHASLVGVTSTNHAPAVRVVPGDPMASVLWHKVSQSTEYGLPMPPNETYLSSSELQTIRDWIEQGAMDN